MEMKFKKISAAFGVLVLSASLLSACSTTSSQKAIIYIQDNTENRSIDGNLVINAAGNKPVDGKIISDAINVSKKNIKVSKVRNLFLTFQKNLYLPHDAYSSVG